MCIVLETSDSVVHNEEKGEQKNIDDAYYFDMFQKKRIQFTKAIFSTTILVILVFGGVGYLIDYFMGTKPAGLVTLIILSFPVSLYLNIKKLKKIA